jgi:hypothetical protein
VAYLATHGSVVIAQPKMPNGSLKDIIYKVEHPTLDWSQKYSSKSTGLKPDKVALYGRQVLEVRRRERERERDARPGYNKDYA